MTPTDVLASFFLVSALQRANRAAVLKTVLSDNEWIQAPRPSSKFLIHYSLRLFESSLYIITRYAMKHSTCMNLHGHSIQERMGISYASFV